MLGLLIGSASLFLSSAGLAPAPATDTWQTYGNVRFGYRICYPANLLHAQPEAANGDGRVFLAADSAKLTVFGRNNAEESTLSETAAEHASDLTGSKGSVRYRVVRRNW